jgi:adenylylsulfate kinase
VTPAPRALLITGTVGSGKSTVMLEVGHVLRERGVPYALVDLDWLCWVGEPAGVTVQEVLVANLAAVWPTFARAGVEAVVLARHVRAAADVESIRTAVGGSLDVVGLDVPRAELEERIRSRDSGSDLDEHLAELDEPVALDVPAVANAGRPARETAVSVLAAAGW